MSFARNTTIFALIAALLATSALAVAQEPADDMEGEAPAIESPMDDEGEMGMPMEDGAAMGMDEEGGAAMRGPGRRAERMLGRLDADDSGDISVEEFGESRLGWVTEADEDGDGVIAMEELTAAIEQRRQERREARLLARFDIDGDGEITVAELERHQEKRFALMDRNDDGVLSAEELNRRGGMRGHGRMGRGGHHEMMMRHHGR